ncbi:MAG: carboxypeptidase-like regulatory domain-containing protein [Terracidiphilus sp.]
MSVRRFIIAFILCVSVAAPAFAEEIFAPDPQLASISGTVMDVNGDIVPDASVILEGPALATRLTIKSKDDGSYSFNGLKPGSSFHVTISAEGFVSWTSPAIVLNPGQYFFLTGSNLQIAGGATSVTVFSSSPAEMAVEQVRVEEQQRVLGIVPNFYVVYDHDAAPLTTKLKFSLALKAETDPITVIGIGLVAGLDQAGATPNYGMGAAGYAQRFGALYANGFTDIMVGGAILPSLLHQDPRYFYQGTGTKKSRALHAISSPFICKGDNGRWEPNYSSIGGDLITGAVSNAYYPETNRGPGLVFNNALVTTGGRMVNGLIQEFVLRRFTPSARN